MNKIIFPFLAPATILYGYFFAIPAVRSLYVSLTEWSGFLVEKKFIGLKNFQRLLVDDIFHQAFMNNLYYTFVAGAIVMILALTFTYILTTNKVKHDKFFANLFYFPNMVAQAAVAVLWVFVFNPNFGLLNNFLKIIGLEQLNRAWLGSRQTAVPAISIALIWRSVGFYLILLLAGVDKIPNTYSEAAKLEGASDIKIFFKITMPLLWDVFVIAISLWLISSLKFFELVWAMTKGGPAQSSHTLATYMFNHAFGDQAMATLRLGYGTSIAVVLFLFSIIVVSFFRWFAERKEAIQY